MIYSLIFTFTDVVLGHFLIFTLVCGRWSWTTGNGLQIAFSDLGRVQGCLLFLYTKKSL